MFEPVLALRCAWRAQRPGRKSVPVLMDFQRLRALTEPEERAISEGSVLRRERVMTMNWETPAFEEIDMSAEIGSYQGEDDNGL